MSDVTSSPRVGLIWRYLLVVVLTSVIAGVVVADQVAGDLRDQQIAEFVEQADGIVQGTAASFLADADLTQPLGDRRRLALAGLADAAMAEEPHTRSVVVATVAGEPWVAAPAGTQVVREAVARSLHAGPVGRVTEVDGEQRFVQTYPVRSPDGTDVMGFVQIQTTTDGLDAATSSAVRRVLLLTGSVIGLVQLLALPLLVQAARRLRRQHDQLQDSALQYEHLATHDQLTGLPNRALFQDRLDVALANARRNWTEVALAVVDLNDFKGINDTLGHATGDAVLRTIAPRMGAAMRGGDTVARFGGDEFVVLLHDVEPGQDTLPAIERLLDAIEQPVHVDDAELTVGASVGIARYPADGGDASELLRRADVALYAAKAAHERVRVYDAGMDAATVDHSTVLTDLRASLQRGDLSLAYQPILALESGEPVAYEALLRWEHPDKGWIPPSVFVTAAERSGLIHELTAFVVHRGLGQLAAAGLAEQGHYLSINVSARDLIGEDLPVVIQQALADHDLPGAALQVEVTETVAMADPVRAIAALGRIRELGVHVVIDDYGTGHSSLAYLQQLPVRSLKIDRGFIRDMVEDAGDRAIVRSTIDLAHHLGLTAVAEGVEDAATAELLRTMGCDLVQGYLYGRPGALRRPEASVLASQAA